MLLHAQQCALEPQGATAEEPMAHGDAQSGCSSAQQCGMSLRKPSPFKLNKGSYSELAMRADVLLATMLDHAFL